MKIKNILFLICISILTNLVNNSLYSTNPPLKRKSGRNNLATHYQGSPSDKTKHVSPTNSGRKALTGYQSFPDTKNKRPSRPAPSIPNDPKEKAHIKNQLKQLHETAQKIESELKNLTQKIDALSKGM